MKRLILGLFVIFGMAVSGANAKCKDANGKIWDELSAKQYMEWSKENYEKVKKEVEEILQIKGLTMEQAIAKNYDYAKFVNGLEMLQKNDDECVDYILQKYADKNNDEYYFYGAKNTKELRVKFMLLLGKDLSGKGELNEKKRKARMEGYSKGVWLDE